MKEYSFGATISALRKEKGLTQEELANRLNVTAQAVSKWEVGNSCPDISALPIIATIFEVSVDYLLGREERQTISQTAKEEKKAFEKEHEFEKLESVCLNILFGKFEILPTKESITRVKVWGDDEFHESNNMSVKDETLYITSDYQNRNYTNNKQNKAIIFLPTESGQTLDVKIKGSGIAISKIPFFEQGGFDIAGSGVIELENFTYCNATITGSGVIKGNDSVVLDATVTGSGRIEWVQSELCNLQVSGSGSIEISDTERCVAKVSGSGNIKGKTAENLQATVSGSGMIRWESVNDYKSKISGSGKVNIG